VAADGAPRYKTNSKAKLLIYIDFEVCFFGGHFVETLDLQGFGASLDKLSTKLSTETLDGSQSLFRSST
jgi:hypothetical protein